MVLRALLSARHRGCGNRATGNGPDGSLCISVFLPCFLPPSPLSPHTRHTNSTHCSTLHNCSTHTHTTHHTHTHTPQSHRSSAATAIGCIRGEQGRPNHRPNHQRGRARSRSPSRACSRRGPEEAACQLRPTRGRRAGISHTSRGGGAGGTVGSGAVRFLYWRSSPNYNTNCCARSSALVTTHI